MKILFIVPSYKPAYVYGGTIVVIYMLAEELANQGHDVNVYTTTANGSEELNVVPNTEVNVDGVKVTYFKRFTGDHTHISIALWQKLFANIKKFDIIHIHSWWSPLVIGAAAICKIRGVKPVFSPHGMLSKYIMETNNASKKRWLHKFIGKPLLKNSTLHVTADSEWDECLEILPKWQGKIIPNMVKLSEKIHSRNQNRVRTLGFLSRIDPKKGLDILFKSLSKVDFDFRLLIAGDGQEEYILELKQLAESLKISAKLEWLGWKNGEEKFNFLSEIDLFVLTSHNENFAIVVIESLSVGTPVLISDKVGLQKYIIKNDFGWVVSLKTELISEKLNQIMQESNKIAKINSMTPAQIRHEFSSNILVGQYIDLYRLVDHKRQLSPIIDPKLL